MSATSDGAPPKHVVLVWEPLARLRPAIARAIARSGAAPYCLRDLSSLANLPASCSAALVALSAPADPRSRSVDIIKALSEKGFTVIAHVDRARGLPLATRCQLYLAGCSSVLDSAEPEFPLELERTIGEALRATAASGEEDARIRTAMAEVGAVGESPIFLSVFRRLTRISALSDLSTLITGETGTGKELLARALYAQDVKRREGPFVAVNCGAISPPLAESELFGHRRGAFTGADRDRKGLIRAADGGVLFLDEIAELNGALQAKLLRVLQEGRVLAVGDEREVPVSVRVIAATNSDLRTMVEAGTFRADLFHRLNVLTLHLPPLRQRRTDIPPLVAHFARRHQALTASATVTIHPDFVDALCRLELPGNARQLENLVRAALVHNHSGRLDFSDLPPEVWQQLAQSESADDRSGTGRSVADSLSPAAGAALPFPAGPLAVADPARLLADNSWNLSRSLDSCERVILESALRVADGNQSRAARLLGITPRSVYNKVRRHKLA